MQLVGLRIDKVVSCCREVREAEIRIVKLAFFQITAPKLGVLQIGIAEYGPLEGTILEEEFNETSIGEYVVVQNAGNKSCCEYPFHAAPIDAGQF